MKNIFAIAIAVLFATVAAEGQIGVSHQAIQTNPSGNQTVIQPPGTALGIAGNLAVSGSTTVSGYTATAIASPANTVGVASTSGGSLTAGMYYAVVAAVDGSGNVTSPSSETSVAVTGSTGSIAWSWSPVAGAFSYQIYVSTTSGAEAGYFVSFTNSFTQTAKTAIPLQAQGTGYWHANGGQLLDSGNNAVRIAGINWYGFETTDEVVHGLYNQDYHTIMKSIAALGYNVVRLPFSNQMVESPIVPTAIAFADINGNAINTDLVGLNSLQIMDKIVTEAGTLNLRVILDDHRSEAGNSAEASGLWYTSTYPQSAWIADWQTLTTRYQGYTTASGQPTVIGADLRNEPHNALSGGSCWTGDTEVSCTTSNTAQNWPVAATLAGNAILAINSNWLIFVEGTDFYNGIQAWWGENLLGVASYPITLSTANRIVYSAHDYGPQLYDQTWFNNSTTYASLSAIWNNLWGYISNGGIAPVWLGEFGTDNAGINIQNSSAGSQGQWFQSIVAYLSATPKIGWSYYALNGDDSYALLDYNYDSFPVNVVKQQLLNTIEPPYITGTNGYVGSPPVVNATGSATMEGSLYMTGTLTSNGNIIGKLGKFASGVQSNGPSTFNQGFTANGAATFNQSSTFNLGATFNHGFLSNLSGQVNGSLKLNQKGVPGAPSGTPSTTGGSMAANHYYAVVVSVDDLGYTTNAGTESISVTTTGATGSIAWTWTAVGGVSSYRIYVGTSSGGESSYFSSTTNSYTQTTTAGTSGTPSYTNQTGSLILPASSSGCLQANAGFVVPLGSACATFFAGTSSAITGTSLSLSCDYGYVSVPGAVVGTPVAVSTTDGSNLGPNFTLQASVTGAGGVTIYICNPPTAAATPPTKTYNVAVF